MKFLADECCDTELVTSLRDDGHDVLYVLEKKAGVTDEEVLFDAYNDGRILLTEDKDFGELVYRLRKPCINPGGNPDAMLCLGIDTKPFPSTFTYRRDPVEQRNAPPDDRICGDI